MFVFQRTSIYLTPLSRFRRNFSASIATPALVKQLREKTGSPMMECKKALESPEVQGDIAKAIDWLRKKGIVRAMNQASNGRKAAQGLIALMKSDKRITMVEVNSETDFVARNQEFQEFVAQVVKHSSNNAKLNESLSIDDLLTSKLENSNHTLNDSLIDVISKIRENISIRRAINISTDSSNLTTQSNKILGSYVHGKIEHPFQSDIQLGRSAGIVELEVISSQTEISSILMDTAKKLAMHTVAAKPTFLSIASIPSDFKNKEIEIFKEQSQKESNSSNSNSSGKTKSPEIMEKMIMGKVNKRLSEIALLEQNHMAEEGSPPINKHLENLSKQLGTDCKINLSRFYLWNVGEEL